MFDLAADPARIAAAFSRTTLLAPLVKARPGLRIPGAWDPFECAVRAVLGQQVSVAAARTLAARLVARAGERIADGVDGLTHLFPSPAALAAADLDGLGLTGARIAALRALARAVADGELDFSASVEEVMAALMSLPGFGAWTAQYVALRALGEPDAFPAADLVLRRMAGNGALLANRALRNAPKPGDPGAATQCCICGARRPILLQREEEKSREGPQRGTKIACGANQAEQLHSHKAGGECVYRLRQSRRDWFVALFAVLRGSSFVASRLICTHSATR